MPIAQSSYIVIFYYMYLTFQTISHIFVLIVFHQLSIFYVLLLPLIGRTNITCL